MQAVCCHTAPVKTPIKSGTPATTRTPRDGRLPVAANTNVVSEALSNSQEARLHRREAEIKTGQEALASALAKTLVLLRYKGKCKCGMMLTDQDKNPNAETYRCPHCNKSGPLAPAPVAAAKQG